MAFIPVSILLPHFHTDNGTPLAGGTLELYEAGTTTPAEFFTAAGVTLGTSESLDARGEPTADLYLDSAGIYKFRLLDASSVLIREWDNVAPPISANGTLEWLRPKSATYVDTNTFTIEGDPRDDAGVAIYHVGRRVRVLLQTSDTYVYATVSAVSHSPATDLTTIDLTSMVSASGVAASLANEPLSAWVGTSAANAATALPSVIVAADYTALQAAAGVQAVSVLGRSSAGDGGGGTFVWMSGDQSVNIAADPQSGLWVAPASDATGASGAWLRRVPRSRYHVAWFGAQGDGVTDDYAAISAAIDFAAQVHAGRIGSVVVFDTGIYLISQKLIQPNRVTLQGANGRGTAIKPYTGFTDTEMVLAVNGTISMFGARLVDLWIDARGFNMLQVVHTKAWQETCGMERVLLQFDGTTKYGLVYSEGFGGSSYLLLRDIEIFTDSTAVGSAGIKVNQVSLVGGFMLAFENGSIVGSSANPIDAGISMINDSLYARGLHVEYCNNAIVMSGDGSLSADTITGSFNGVTNMISIGSGFTGKLNLRNIIPNGATGNLLNNLITGVHIPASRGMLSALSYPDVLANNTVLAWVVFAGATGTITTSHGVSSVTRSSTGRYVINLSDTIPSEARAVSITTDTDSPDQAYGTHAGSNGSQDFVNIRRTSTGAYFDATTVEVGIFGNRI